MATTSPLLARRRAGTAAAVPLTLITGFLGAGKTTLLNRLLSGDHGLRVAVLVNDFGAVNIDAELVVGVEDGMLSLANGCVCCEIRDDLIRSLEELLARPEEIDYVILEASGVADPEGVVMTFLDRRYEGLLRLDSITCIVDADGIFATGDDQGLTMLKLRQIGFADLVVLNKVDLVGPANVQVIREWIGTHFTRVRIVEAVHCDLPLQVLLAVGRFDPARQLPEGDEHPHAHGPSFETWSYTSERPFSSGALTAMIRRELPASVYRCKGIVFADDRPDKRLALQTVGRRSEITELGGWDERPRRSQIVAIGASGDLEPEALRALFDGCLAPQAVHH